jgi:tRNA(Ile)-lysidine synthase
MAHPKTERRRAVQPLWSALERSLGPHLERGALLCVSGGPDSSALLEACARWERRAAGLLEVAAVDHGQRPAARAETEAVVARARALGFEGHRLLVSPRGRGEGALREARYEALFACARERGLCALVTAHHEDDDAEGLLLDLLGLGGGREGAAMAEAAETERGLVLRPFARLSRAQLALAFSALPAPAPFEDPHDAAGRGARAAVRARALPALCALVPAARARLAQKARRRAEDEAALGALAAAALVGDEGGLLVPAGLPRAVARRAVMEALRHLGAADPRRASRTLDQALDAAGFGTAPPRAGARFDLPGARGEVTAQGLRILPAPPARQGGAS